MHARGKCLEDNLGPNVDRGYSCHPNWSTSGAALPAASAARHATSFAAVCTASHASQCPSRSSACCATAATWDRRSVSLRAVGVGERPVDPLAGSGSLGTRRTELDGCHARGEGTSCLSGCPRGLYGFRSVFASMDIRQVKYAITDKSGSSSSERL
eukprot:364443-Chlamydomonas_euryale.AAC.28